MEGAISCFFTRWLKSFFIKKKYIAMIEIAHKVRMYRLCCGKGRINKPKNLSILSNR